MSDALPSLAERMRQYAAEHGVGDDLVEKAEALEAAAERFAREPSEANTWKLFGARARARKARRYVSNARQPGCTLRCMLSQSKWLQRLCANWQSIVRNTFTTGIALGIIWARWPQQFEPNLQWLVALGLATAVVALAEISWRTTVRAMRALQRLVLAALLVSICGLTALLAAVPTPSSKAQAIAELSTPWFTPHSAMEDQPGGADPDRLYVSVALRNSGPETAKNMAWGIVAMLLPTPVTTDGENSLLKDLREPILDRSIDRFDLARDRARFKTAMTRPLGEADKRDLRQGRMRLYVAGFASYSDTIASREVESCWWLQYPGPPVWQSCIGHNRSP